jgi:hypothetical protein
VIEIMSALEVFRLVIAFNAIATLIGATEWLYLHRQFRSSGLYAWEVQQIGLGQKADRCDLLFRYPNVLALPAAQFLASLPATPPAAVGLCCGLIAACYWLMSYRGLDGFYGADAMAKVVMLAGAVSLPIGSDLAARSALVFISVQLVIAYSTPGWFRLFDREWHSGRKLLGVMRTEMFGRKAVWMLLNRNRRLSGMIASMIALWEACFLLYIFLPYELLLIALTAGILFHVTNAFVMGLNLFPWTFVGSYPAIIYTSQMLRTLY